jgi:hypothetical protein
MILLENFKNYLKTLGPFMLKNIEIRLLFSLESISSLIESPFLTEAVKEEASVSQSQE